MKSVQIGDRRVGDKEPVHVVAEVGINHNGDIELAKALVEAACKAGCDGVKFQKRTIEDVYTVEELEQSRESPFGTTNGDLKRALEFGEGEYYVLNSFCSDKGIDWFASCWDEKSVHFIEAFNPPCYKIASASLTDDALLKTHRATGRPLILSTGMSTLEQIDHAVGVLGTDNLVILHATSSYPCKLDELNLRVIPFLKERYDVPVGYSGHEPGISTTIAAVALGACMVERHLTLDRAMFGSDQAASVEPFGFARLVRDIHSVTQALGDGVKRVYESELPVQKKLRRR